jgi:hypothetical protein
MLKFNFEDIELERKQAKDFCQNYYEYLRLSKEAAEQETQKYGGNPGPGDPGWELYFQKVEN